MSSTRHKRPCRNHPGKTTNTETRILEIARDLLVAGGIQSLSMRAVAAKVGISATAIYHYFDSKQDLVDRVVEMGIRRLHEDLRQAIASQPAGSLEKLLSLAEAYILFAYENQQYFQVIYRIRSDALGRFEDLPVHSGYDLMRQCVGECIENGVFRSGDPAVISTYLWSIIHGLVTLTMTCSLHSGEPHGPGDQLETQMHLLRAFAPYISRGLQVQGTDEYYSDEDELTPKSIHAQIR